MSAASASAQFGADDRDDLDALFAEKRIGVRIAIVGHYHSRREGDDIVSAVPLLAFRGIGIAAGFHDAPFLYSEGVRYDIDQGFGFACEFDRLVTASRP